MERPPSTDAFWPSLKAVVACLSIALFCMAGPLVGAVAYASVDASLDVRGTVQFQGEADLGLSSLGSTYDSVTPDQQFRFEMTVERARLRIVNFPYTISGYAVDPLGRKNFSFADSPEEISQEEFTGRLQLRAAGSNASYRLLPLDEGRPIPMQILGNKTFRIQAPRGEHAWPRMEYFSTFASNVSHSLRPASHGGLLEIQSAPEFIFEGNAFAFLFGGAFSLTDAHGRERIISTGRALNETRSHWDPTGSVGTWRYDQTVILVEAPSSQTRLLSPRSPSDLKVVVDSVRGRANGDVLLTGVSGNLSVQGSERASKAELFQTIGFFAVDAKYDGSGSHWTLSGSASFVAVDTVPIFGFRPVVSGHLPTAIIIVAAAGGTALLSVLIWTLGRGLGAIAGRNETTPLGNPIRQFMLNAIREKPGISRAELEVLFPDKSRRFARHHLRILQRAHLVDVVRHANRETFMLNGGTYRRMVRPQSGEVQEPNGGDSGAVPLAAALASLSHPVRRMAAEILSQRGPLTTRQVRVALNSEVGAMDHDLLDHHLRAMMMAGFLSKRRMGRHNLWSVRLSITSGAKS